jgi:hypothetical protein
MVADQGRSHRPVTGRGVGGRHPRAHPRGLPSVAKRKPSDDPARRISLLVGRGGAKTTTKRARAIIKLVTLRNQFIGYAATSADQARDLNWNKLKSACEAYEIRSEVTSTVSKAPDVSFLDTKMILTCNRTGSSIGFVASRTSATPRSSAGSLKPSSRSTSAARFRPNCSNTSSVISASRRVSARPTGARWRQTRWLHRARIHAAADAARHLLRGHARRSKRHRRWTDRDKQKPDGSPEFPNWKGYSSHSWTLRDVVDLPDGAERLPGARRELGGGAGREGGEGLGRRSPDLAARVPRASGARTTRARCSSTARTSPARPRSSANVAEGGNGTSGARTAISTSRASRD